MTEKVNISVKHYLNTRAKARTNEAEEFYPLYIQLIASGQRAQLKSRIPEYLIYYRNFIDKHYSCNGDCNLINEGYFTPLILNDIQSNKMFPLYELLNDEILLLQDIIRSSRNFNKKSFKLINLGELYDHHLKDIYQVLEQSVKRSYLLELNMIFRESTRNEDNRRLFKLTNYFLHYLNWDSNFCEYYETTYEVLPSEIKFIENYLSDYLKLQIKAVMAFHSRNNFLRRYMDKTEKGQFPSMNYTDWKNKAREFLSKEFIGIFGKQKAMEYIKIIDKILEREINS